MTNFLTSWRIFDMACFWRHYKFFYVMTFLKSRQTFWRHDTLFDIFFTTNFLTSWQIFWRHDVFLVKNLLTSWHIFDATTNLLMSRLTFWRIFSNADLSGGVVVIGDVNYRGGGGGGGGNLRNAFTFSIFLAWSFFGMTLTTYHKKDLVESL